MRKYISTTLLLALSLSFNACGSGGGNSSSTTNGGSTVTDVTALDGYIKNATIKDVSGQTATYSGVGGKYTFASSVAYPLTLTGGTYEDTNVSFDINMSCSSGTVISPITTFIDGNSTVLEKLANLALSGNPATLSDFSVDYVAINNTDLAKLAQLLYVVEKDANLTHRLRADMNATSLNALYTQIESDINATVTDTTLQNNMRVFVQKVKDINATLAVSSYESTLKAYKSSFVTITWKGKTYGQVVSPYTGKIWLDRNLGASRVATAVDDNQSYGDYYQWGRAADGHQESNSSTTTTLSANINATDANGKFITNSNDPYDWVASGVDDNGSVRSAAWSKTDGSSICPAGYRVPTITELTAETTSASNAVNNQTDAFNNFLKFPSAGNRSLDDGSVSNQGSLGFAWSSSPTGSYSYSLYFDSGSAGTLNDGRAYGFSVRCLKD